MSGNPIYFNKGNHVETKFAFSMNLLLLSTLCDLIINPFQKNIHAIKTKEYKTEWHHNIAKLSHPASQTRINGSSAPAPLGAEQLKQKQGIQWYFSLTIDIHSRHIYHPKCTTKLLTEPKGYMLDLKTGKNSFFFFRQLVLVDGCPYFHIHRWPPWRRLCSFFLNIRRALWPQASVSLG